MEVVAGTSQRLRFRTRSFRGYLTPAAFVRVDIAPCLRISGLVMPPVAWLPWLVSILCIAWRACADPGTTSAGTLAGEAITPIPSAARHNAITRFVVVGRAGRGRGQRLSSFHAAAP
jgi:hypothetical protein